MALQAHSERLDREHRQGAWIAWHTAALGRVKRMPKLEELIGGKVHAAVQSAEQMKSVFAAMRARAAET